MYKIIFLVLFAFANLFAGDLFVETLDEQLSSNNLLVLRFRINNPNGPLQNAVLKYCLQKSPGKNIVVDNYYVGNTRVSLHEIDSANACVEFAMEGVPSGIFPDQGGYSAGIHYSDWSARNKSLDFGKPQSSSFTRAENIALYVDDGLVYGSEPIVAEPARIEVKFTAFRPDSDGAALAFVDVKNLGNRSVSIDSLYFRDTRNQRVRALRSSLGVDEKVRVYLDSLPGKVTKGKSGELLMEYGNTPVDYIAWGASGQLASVAHENGVWSDASDFVKDFGENVFGFVPDGNGLFYARSDLNEFHSYAWQVYSEYDSETYEEYLPDATPYALPSGTRVALEKSQPMRFVWNQVPYADRYRLLILSAKDSSLIYQNTYTMRVADVDLPAGDYLWIVQSANSEKTFKPIPERPKLVVGRNSSNPIENAVRWFAGYVIRIKNSLEASQYVEYVRIGAPNDTIVSSNGRKDTRLLNISWGEYADVFGWDTIHSPAGPGIRDFDADEGFRCWAITIQELNHYYTTKDGKHGDLTLDEIMAKVKIHSDTMDLVTGQKKKKPDFGPALAAFRLREANGGYRHEVYYGLKYALNLDSLTMVSIDDYEKVESVYYKFNGGESEWNCSLVVEKWKNMLKSNKPVYMSQCMALECTGWNGPHAMIIDGYRLDSKGELQFHFINTTNYGTNGWRDWSDDVLGVLLLDFYEFEIPTDVALTDPDVHTDTDGDGIMDFDEKYRFDSDYRYPDSDGDSIDDKTEIHSYVIRENARFNSKDVYIRGVIQEVWADVDGDGKRAENDPDSDGDDIGDGDEDLNRNGYVDAGETDPYVYDYVPPAVAPDSVLDIPDDIALYAFDLLKLNDHVVCLGYRKGCDVASEQESNSAVILGVGVSVENVYSKGKVWLRNEAKVTNSIRYYVQPGVLYETEMQDKASCQFEYPIDVRRWPFSIPNILPKENLSNKDTVIRNGEIYVLNDGESFRSLKVESGGTILISTGEMVVDNLQLDANSDIYFTDPGYRTVMHVNNNIKWNGNLKNPDADSLSIAKGFKLYYYGTETFDVAGSWRGTIIAPNAMLILGQNHNKIIYGRFLAYQLVVHQYAQIRTHKFNPVKSTATAVHQELVFKEE